MSNLRPESRIKSLEKRATDIEAAIEELSSDQAEELKAIRLEIKQLDEGMTSSFKELGGYFELTEKAMATKDDLKQGLATLKADQDARFDKIEATQEQILKLLQQKP